MYCSIDVIDLVLSLCVILPSLAIRISRIPANLVNGSLAQSIKSCTRVISIFAEPSVALVCAKLFPAPAPQ